MMHLTRWLMRQLPDTLAFRLLLRLSNRLRPLPMSTEETAAMQDAHPLRYGPQDSNQAWAWGNDGPLIILVHGWGGRAAQFGPLAQRLAALGYRCVAPDVTGHGDTRRRKTRWSWFHRDITDLVTTLNTPVHAFVGHSAGGLTMMAARSHGAFSAPNYICICTPSFPFPPLRRVKSVLAPSDAVMARYEHYLATEFGMPWDALKNGASFAGLGADLLLIYEERDRFIPHTEGDRIQALCPGSKLVKTNAYGHQRILTAPDLADRIHRAFGPTPAPESGQ